MSIPAVHEPHAQGQALPSELNIKEALEVLRRRKAVFIEVFVMVLAVCIVATALGKPVYMTYAKMLVPSVTSSVNVVDSSNPISSMLAAAQPDSVSTQLQTLQSGPFVEEAKRQAGVVNRKQVVPPSVRAEALEGTNVIQVTVEGGDPQGITKLAEKIVELHVDRNDLLTTTGLKKTLEFVRKEHLKAADKLADAEKALLEFRQANRLVGLPTEREARTGEYAALLARTIELESNISATRSQIGHLKSRLNQEQAELEQVITKENPRVAKLQDKLDDLKFQRMDLLREYKPTSRPVRDLDHQIGRLEQQLADAPHEIKVRSHSVNPNRALLETRLQELETSLKAYEENHRTAAAQYQAKKGLMDNLAPAEAELARLTRERDTAQTNASLLADRLRDLEMRRDARMPTVRAIERPRVPTVPIRPNKPKGIFLSVILALVLAAGTVFLQEFLDDRVNAPEEIERQHGLPILANVPLMANDQPRLVAALPGHSPVAESYRALRAAIGFAGIDAPIRRIQVTSPTKGEGKSTTSVNLAISMARDGKQVILIDADMRAPSIHRLLDLSPSPGLSELLAGMATVEVAHRPTEIPNLLVVPAGAIPPNPAELLGSRTFDKTVEELEQLADILIFDTPPCLPVTDPIIVASRMDGVVLVLQAGQTRKGSIKKTIELLGRARARILGMVYNQVQPHGSGYYYYQPYSYGDSSPNGATQRERHHRNGKERTPELERARTVAANSPGTKDEEV